VSIEEKSAMALNISKLGPNEWFLDVRYKKNGKQFRQRETFAGTKQAAEERYLDLKKGLRNEAGSFRADAPTKFKDLLDLYKKRRLSLGSLDETRFIPLMRDLGETTLDAFPDTFERYLKVMKGMPAKTTGKPLSNGTHNRYLTMVKTCFKLALDLGVLEKNPMNKARFPMLKEVARDKSLSQIEVQRLLNTIATEAPHLEQMVRFALQVPCRRSELVNMRQEDLDLIHNAIRVRNGTTKSDRGCWKPIPPEMAPYFRSIPGECPWLFYRVDKGAYCHLGDFKKAWNRCLKLAGITDFRFHDTRHISATNLVDNGTPEQVVMSVAGWKTNMLRTYYSRGDKKALGLVRFTLQASAAPGEACHLGVG
jgi:integrase